jgi:hypothetical protein
MMNQRQATVKVLLSVLSNAGIEYELNGETPISNVLEPHHKDQARTILCTMFKQGQVQYRPEFQAKVNDDAQLRSYVGGLVNNWIRKAKEFNNGQAYQPKNPGARAGAGDKQVKELKKLLAKVKGTEHESKVQAALAKRLEEIKPKVEIDESQLPEELRGLI